MEIRPICTYDESAVLALYRSVGWTAYTDDPDSLRQGFANSLLILGAYESDTLLGLLRAVGDGHTVVLVQDILIFPEYQRQGIGTALLRVLLERYAHVRQVQLATDNTPRTTAFYRSMGFREFSELGCCGFMREK